jgi:zinc transporter ZupT
VDALKEALEKSADVPEPLSGTALVVLGVGGSVLVLICLTQWIGRRRRKTDETYARHALAYMIAAGIGLHNLGEGLAIGAAYSAGLLSLGSLLVIGFTLHNVTEGLAIVSPLARGGPRGGGGTPLGQLGFLGMIGGLPTVLGAWIGGFNDSALWSVVFLSIGAGAVLQVVLEILRQIAGGEVLRRILTAGPNLAGLAGGFLVMYVTRLLVPF